MSFLGLEGKNIVIFGMANKKSIAYSIGKILKAEGGNPIYVVHTDSRKKNLTPLLGEDNLFVCDVENEEDIDKIALKIKERYNNIYGIVHSIAFANYQNGFKPFHETVKTDFLQALNISCYSLIKISNTFRNFMDKNGAVVAISISTTKMAAETYGYMAPVKAALDSTICFLAKSFSNFSEIRFNAVCAGLLKTSSSAGIPGYVDYYLYAEKITLRKRALTTDEVANTAVFLLSHAASGINAQGVVIDAGMSVNYFNKEMVTSLNF